MSNVFRPNRPVSYDNDSILAEIKRVINEHFQGKPPSSDKFNKWPIDSAQQFMVTILNAKAFT
jgi:hypothetical protein